ncbi:MAG: hypothetical protein E7440_03130 [Ruminococcaceae bacterium]|nr:hypothetical protein [Oscillospiraceae bacterium]
MRKRLGVLLIILLLTLFTVLPPCAFLVYGIWSTSVHPNSIVPFPEGTQILRETDNHQGFFRSKGIAVIVAQIPEDYIQAFGNRLKEEWFSAGPPIGRARDLLATIEETKDILDSPNTLFNYEDEALAFLEEPFSDCSTAIYDLETGLFCFLEYDE